MPRFQASIDERNPGEARSKLASLGCSGTNGYRKVET